MARNSFNGTEGVLLGDENVTYPLPFSAQEQVLVDDMMRSVPCFSVLCFSVPQATSRLELCRYASMPLCC
jgi:hypothetical protein